MQRIVACLVLLFTLVSAWAHESNQFRYEVLINEDQGSLTLHFTPEAVLDLIISELPQLADEPSIRLADYEEVIEQYINDKFQLTIDNQLIKCELVESNLYEHDATVRFDFSNVSKTKDHWSVSIDAFKEIYHHVTHDVTLEINGVQTAFTLNESETAYAMGAMKKAQPFYKRFAFIGIGLILLVGAVLIIKMKYKPR